MAEDPGDASIDAPAGAAVENKKDFGTIELMIPDVKAEGDTIAPKTLTISEVANIPGIDDPEKTKEDEK